MCEQEEAEAVKKYELQLSTFGKQNKQKFKIIDDLTLSLDCCKTPEVKDILKQSLKQHCNDVNASFLALDKKLQADLDAIAKRAAKSAKGKSPGAAPPSASQQKETKLKFKLSVDSFNKKYLPSGSKIWLEFKAKPKNEFPFFDPKKSSVMLNWGVPF